MLFLVLLWACLLGTCDARLPGEFERIQSVIIAVNNIDTYERTQDEVFNIWKQIIDSAQRQNVTVYMYITVAANVSAVIQTFPMNNIVFVTDYPVDSIWIRDYGPIFYYDANLRLLDSSWFLRCIAKI